MNGWTLFITSFITGLTTGAITCAATQGGLLASVIANQKNTPGEDENTPEKYADFVPTAMFLGAKLISHTILGFFLGLAGSVLSLSLGVRLAFQIFAAVFMFATAMNLLNVHPIFRFVAIQPPKFLQRIIRKQSKRGDLFAPGFLGLMTIFIPCGVTQAMEVTAITSGNPIFGALIMSGFVLGTSPVFALVGLATSKLSGLWKARFNLVAATALILMSLYSINGVLNVLNAPINFNIITDQVELAITPPSLYAARLSEQKGSTLDNSLPPLQNDVQKVKINIQSNGYSPRYLKVRQNVPVELELESNGVYSCASEFVLRKFHITQRLAPTDRKVVKFTPTEIGKFPYSCAMGMFNGVLEVVKNV